MYVKSPIVMAVISTNSERTQRTRSALITTARRCFAGKGFGATGTEELVREAGVTRGALYHHFEDKTALFAAVVESISEEVVLELARSVEGCEDAATMLLESAEACLDLCRNPEVRQIMLIDAPAVLGWQAWREIDGRHALGFLRGMLEQLAVEEVISAAQVVPLSHLILGAVTEAALVVAHEPEDAQLRQRIGRELRWLLLRLTTP